MRYEKRTYFKEREQDDVKGFTILAAKNGEYHIVEKWLREDADDLWMDYLITEEDLLDRVEADKCQKAGKLNDQQFDAVSNKATGPTKQSA